VPSDIIVHSQNILEAARGLYDKYINCSDLLQLNISADAFAEVDTFFLTYAQNVKRIFDRQTNTNLAQFGFENTDAEVDVDENQNGMANELSVHQTQLVREMTVNDEHYVQGSNLRVVSVSDREKRKLMHNFGKQQAVSL
jgi:hypothetical protein